jgi:hypothetical protein
METEGASGGGVRQAIVKHLPLPPPSGSPFHVFNPWKNNAMHNTVHDSGKIVWAAEIFFF